MNRILRRIAHIYYLCLSLIIRCFTRVHKKRILCWSYYYTKYSCNPRYITEYLLSQHLGEFEIYWCFKDNINITDLPPEIKIVRWRTWRYFFILYTASFLITNARTGIWSSSFIKKKGQKYIMTWHSSMGVKKVEKDAEDKLPKAYIKTAKYDSSICDLILSGCRLRSEIIKRAFWYNGEILEKGTPRNDVLFQNHDGLRKKILLQHHIPMNAKILLYAPTFRKDMGLQYYKLNWKDAIPVLEQKFGSPVYVFIRLHPNFCSSGIDALNLCNDERVCDFTYYHDMHELLCISDILVTDYSSSLFDFSLLYRPCFIYAADYSTYDRGTYLQLNELPFPLSQNDDEFLNNIESFDETNYINGLLKLNNEIIGTYEKGQACEELYKWMIL